MKHATINPVRVAIALLFLALALAIGLQSETIVVRTIERDGAQASVIEYRQLATEASAAPNAKGARPLLSDIDAKAALRGLKRNRSYASSAPIEAVRAASEARARSVRADVALTRTQAANVVTFRRATPVIAALGKVKPTGNATVDAATIADVTEQPWKGWQ